jgi:hypothetical protein
MSVVNSQLGSQHRSKVTGGAVTTDNGANDYECFKDYEQAGVSLQTGSVRKNPQHDSTHESVQVRNLSVPDQIEPFRQKVSTAQGFKQALWGPEETVLTKGDACKTFYSSKHHYEEKLTFGESPVLMNKRKRPVKYSEDIPVYDRSFQDHLRAAKHSQGLSNTLESRQNYIKNREKGFRTNSCFNYSNKKGKFLD